LDQKKNTLNACCSKKICKGCYFANKKREIATGLDPRCAFCREPLPKTDEELHKLTTKRVKKKDPVAMCRMGRQCIDKGDFQGAFKYFTKAAELGDAVAHYQLSVMYLQGDAVEKDKEKEIYHLEEAAIGGHPWARHNLGCEEAKNGRLERAKKHYIIAANLGYHDSLEGLKILYVEGTASKEDYAGSLRAYQAAVEATKSVEREEAEMFYKSFHEHEAARQNQ
jgi:TPR repeat protein